MNITIDRRGVKGNTREPSAPQLARPGVWLGQGAVGVAGGGNRCMEGLRPPLEPQAEMMTPVVSAWQG